MLLHRSPPSFTDRRDTPAFRAFVLGESNPDWDALVAGASSPDPLPELDDEPEPTFECHYCLTEHPRSEQCGTWDMPACSCCAERLGV